jgi:hypothetical protein
MSLKLLRDVPFGAVLCLVGTNYINSANAQQTDQQTIVTEAEIRFQFAAVEAHGCSLRTHH